MARSSRTDPLLAGSPALDSVYALLEAWADLGPLGQRLHSPGQTTLLSVRPARGPLACRLGDGASTLGYETDVRRHDGAPLASRLAARAPERLSVTLAEEVHRLDSVRAFLVTSNARAEHWRAAA
jgi:hypothetical protein